MTDTVPNRPCGTCRVELRWSPSRLQWEPVGDAPLLCRNERLHVPPGGAS